MSVLGSPESMVAKAGCQSKSSEQAARVVAGVNYHNTSLEQVAVVGGWSEFPKSTSRAW
ncbi:hypothetical protein CONPUDRAFT_84570 [Coniophora puteana RWD-64-598 SS2]|uniref:Uncharacterized protein n=1 Tax=Coniophora puteana (strain RWD-64-598) TaxID=741705 RepID=A0A5M3MC15_CONPW|nr:uncharacterized protein CONPUDRAFT_84570 [Coniophora puteana RWD-64-598 SS2]EIW76587.1 hypothetical protein CONPUDRAFT_84570 [Coniophora puteana RWD-64-598 SS2]